MNVHDFLEYRMEKVARSVDATTGPLTKKNRKKMKKSFGRFKQGVSDMIMLPSYAEGIVEGGKQGAKGGAVAGFGSMAGTIGGLEFLDRKMGGAGVMGTPGAKNIAAQSLLAGTLGGGLLGGQVGAALGANEVRLRRKLARSRRMKALGALAAGGAGLGAMSAMRKKKK